MGRRGVALGTVGSVLAALAVGLAPSASAAGTSGSGQVALGALDAAVSQSFDSLAGTGTSNALPTGWYLDEAGTGSAADGSYAAGTGSSNSGNAYSFGAAGSSERAFGGLQSSSVVPTVGAQLSNSTGGTVTSLDLAYTGEQWRYGGGTGPDRIDFQYSTDATSLTSGTWTHVDALDFSSPVTTTTGAKDGNGAPNRTAVSGTVGDLSLAPGDSVWIRWTSFDIPGSDDGLSVDDFAVTPRGFASNDDAPAVVSTTPADGDSGVELGSDLTVTFTEPVTAGASSFTLACDGTSRTFAVSGGGTSYTVDPDNDFANGESCTFTVLAEGVSDTDATDPPDHPLADHVVTFGTGDACLGTFTPAYAVQGSGDASQLVGQTVTTQGVVVGDYEGPSPTLRGFYLQDVAGDGDAATSDALFVFNGSSDSVALGDVVRVRGTVSEFQDQTQLSSVSSVTACGTASVAPTAVTLPFATASSAEKYEGMLVELSQTLSVTEHFQLGRFGQVVMSSGGRLQQPTNVAEPGAAAQALQAANDLNRIIVDDELNNQNPDPIRFGRGGQPLSASNTLRGGDTATGIVGVMTYTWAGNAASGNAYRVRPVGALGGGVPDFQPANPRPDEAPERASNVDVRVAGMNLLNFFNTFDGRPDATDNCKGGVTGPAMDCRGADDQVEFDRQWVKTVEAVTGTEADVVGVVEIENDGYGPDSAIQFLVDKLNTKAGPGTYAFVDVDAGTGQVDALGDDAIKVGVLYKPAVVSPVGQTAALNSEAFVNGGDASPRNRPALAQAFAQNTTGETFVVSVNHLKSKGSACAAPDAGDGQGNCNQVRTTSAQLLTDWLASDPTATGDSDALIMGDLNAYAMEDPIAAIEADGYTNLVKAFVGEDAYSYVFDGQWGYLDHALGTASMTAQVADVHDWHVNADEPGVLDYNTDFKSAGQVASLYAPDEFRISDHDPVLVDLALTDFPFDGFRRPAENPPAVNVLKAGQSLPLKFGLGGDRGLDVVESVTVTPTDCGTGEPTGPGVPATSNDGLTYDAGADEYSWVWKPVKGSTGCAVLTMRLSDSSGHELLVRFR